jgi:hypothetical protein
MSLSIWTIYRHPSDYPGQYVARRYAVDEPTSDVLTGKTLTEVRAKLPRGLFCIQRHPGDDPVIVECWL